MRRRKSVPEFSVKQEKKLLQWPTSLEIRVNQNLGSGGYAVRDYFREAAHHPIRFALLRNSQWSTPEEGMEHPMTDKN